MTVMRDAQYCNLSRDMPHDSEKSDHFPLQLDLSCSISTPSAGARSTPSQSSTRPQFKYVESQADAYQQCLTAELLMHLVPLLTGAIDIDSVVAILIACMVRAAQQTLPEKRKRSDNNTFPRNPWFNAECKAAKKVKNRVLHSDASEHEKKLAVQHFRSVTAKVKATWLERRSDELCEMARKDPQAFWRVFKTQQHDVCPLELAAQFEAFRALMGSQPAQIPEQAELLGTSVRAADASCLNASITSEELHDCIKRLKRNKSPGIDGVLSEMIKDGGDVLHNCLLVIFNLMLVNHFPKQLSVGLITAVYKSGDKGDMSNYRGITVGSVIAKLFAMILDHRIAVWAEGEGIKAKGQAGFRKNFRTTDNIFVLKSLIDKQKQTHGKLYSCFVDFKKAFDTVPRGLLWQVLENVGIRGPILDCIKSLYSHDSAAVRNQEGISDSFDCLMGVKQGCPLSATLFGLFVDGLEQHLMGTLGHDAPSLSGALIPLLLYADDLTIMSTTAAGLQRQLNALQLFCEQRQLSVNLAKTKVVTFGSRAQCQAFMFNGNEVERVQSYKYLGFEFHATKSLAHGVSKLVSAANKAMHAMNRRCAFLHISDPKQRCQLFDSLVLPILSYASEVWAVDAKVGDAAEQLHRQFLKHVLGVRGNTANFIVLAEFGRYPLCFHWWQQILRYHNRINKLSDDDRLIKCAFVEGLHDPLYHFWSHDVQKWLQLQSSAQSIEDDICVSTTIDNAKALYRQALHQSSLNSVDRYCQMVQLQHQDYILAPYLSALKNFRSRRLVSRFRCGCHGLHVDTGNFKPGGQKVPREHRLCLVCGSDTAEDEHHFVFDCPAYCSIRDRFTAIFWGPAPTLSSFFTLHDPRVIAKFLHECFTHRSMLLEG